MRADDGGRGGAERQREREQEFYCFPLISGKIGSDGKVFAYNVGDQSLIPGSGRSSGEGNGNPLQYSCLGNPMDEGAWQTYHPWGRKVRHDFTFTFFLEGKLFHRARRPWTEQRQGSVGRTSVQKGLSLILLELVSLSVAICNGPGIWRACL